MPTSSHDVRARAWTGGLEPVSLVMHGPDDLDEARDVAAGDQAGELAALGRDVLLGRVQPILERALHDALESLIHLLPGPVEALYRERR